MNRIVITLAGLAMAAGACAAPSGSVDESADAEPGAPIPGLTADESARFLAGQALFGRPFTPDEGLGPAFNQAQCSACHDLPSSGGHGAEPVTKVSHFEQSTGCNLLEADGGDLLQEFLIPAAREMGLAPERIPESANAVTLVVPPALYGLGLVEHVDVESILASADPDDEDADGISGRTGTGPDGEPGRFGFKAQHSTLRGFIEGAVRGELGLTTPDHPVEERPGGQELPEGLDVAADPEVDDAFIDALTDYVRHLAPPVRRPVSSETARSVELGERIFSDIGCASCHTPELVTAPSPGSPTFDGRAFRAYTDLLLHDMGPELADICAPGATPSEWRTARLVGLGLRDVFLHNGRAQRLSTAIELHGGEGSAARDAFQALDAADQDMLLSFLRTL